MFQFKSIFYMLLETMTHRKIDGNRITKNAGFYEAEE